MLDSICGRTGVIATYNFRAAVVGAPAVPPARVEHGVLVVVEPGNALASGESKL